MWWRTNSEEKIQRQYTCSCWLYTRRNTVYSAIFQLVITMMLSRIISQNQIQNCSVSHSFSPSNKVTSTYHYVFNFFFFFFFWNNVSSYYSSLAFEKQLAIYHQLQCLHLQRSRGFFLNSHLAVIRAERSLVWLNLNEFISSPGSTGWSFWSGLLMKACLALREQKPIQQSCALGTEHGWVTLADAVKMIYHHFKKPETPK